MLYVLLPAYNEEDSIDAMMEDFEKVLPGIGDYEIIICNDGSRDKTLDKVRQWEKKLPLTVIHHKINRGLGETERDLFEAAAEKSKPGDIIVRMDCDDTHTPEIIPSLINKIREGYDVVIASRFATGGDQKGVEGYRKYISYAATLFMRFFFPIKGLKEYTCGYRAYTAEILQKAISTYGNNFIQLKGLGFTGTLETVVKLKMLDARFAEIPFVLRYDKKKSLSKMVTSITTLGYFVMVLLYYWPFGGWLAQKKARASDKKK